MPEETMEVTLEEALASRVESGIQVGEIDPADPEKMYAMLKTEYPTASKKELLNVISQAFFARDTKNLPRF